MFTSKKPSATKKKRKIEVFFLHLDVQSSFSLVSANTKYCFPVIAIVQLGLVGAFNLTVGVLICTFACWLWASGVAGVWAGFCTPGAWTWGDAVVTTCCWISFCCTTWAVAVVAGITWTCCCPAVVWERVTVWGWACTYTSGWKGNYKTVWH